MSIFDFSGKSARNTIAMSREAQQGRLDTGYRDAKGAIIQGRDTATNYLQPYLRGSDGFEKYSNALGVNGRDAQNAEFQSYQSDPWQTAARSAGDNVLAAMRRQYNSQGMGTQSGNLYDALNRRSQDLEAVRQGAYLDRLAGLGQTGFQAAGQAGGYASNAGNQLGDLSWQHGQALAGNEGAAAAATNQARAQGQNNLMGLIGMGASLATAALPGGASRAAMPKVANPYWTATVRRA